MCHIHDNHPIILTITNTIIMRLQEFREKYGQNISITVCKEAFLLFKKGIDPILAVSSACEQFLLKMPLKHSQIYCGYLAKSLANKLTIYKVETDSQTAQEVICKYPEKLADNGHNVAWLGENVVCSPVCTYDIGSPTEVIGVHNHKNHIMAVVKVSGFTDVVQHQAGHKLIDLIALNAVAYYSLFQCLEGENSFVDFLQRQYIYGLSQAVLIDRIRQGIKTTIGAELDRFAKQINAHLKIDEITIFGQP